MKRFHVASPPTTGSKPQTYGITGPGWSGTLPKGVTELKSATGLVWVLGRIYCTGTPEDYKAVHALQDKFSVVTSEDTSRGRRKHRGLRIVVISLVLLAVTDGTYKLPPVKRMD